MCRFFNKKISAIHQINQYSVGKEQETLFSNGFFIYPPVSSIFPVEQLETSCKGPFCFSLSFIISKVDIALMSFKVCTITSKGHQRRS